MERVAKLHHQVGARFGFDRIRAAATSLAGGDAFERLAVRRLVEELFVEQTALTRTIMKFSGGVQAADDPKAAISAWTALHSEQARSVGETLENVERAPGDWSFAKLTIANAALREIAAAANRVGELASQ